MNTSFRYENDLIVEQYCRKFYQKTGIEVKRSQRGEFRQIGNSKVIFTLGEVIETVDKK